ncbi:hypothetical protein BKA61DRAFT_575502 [Leptodontidium sp. MPI-SDFR-AT-0119]|nr:hypothetical protein BKA61DRAFT_575502 [Leptodontidium sp. MPI-SDFR-AT-0119]
MYHPGPRSVEQLYRLLRRQSVTTSTRRVLDRKKAEPLMPGLLHRDNSGLSNSDSASSGDDDECPSEDERGRSSKHSRWSDLDEERLLAYKKEDKSWGWIFSQCPGRTRPAIRSGPEATRRWTGASRIAGLGNFLAMGKASRGIMILEAVGLYNFDGIHV